MCSNVRGFQTKLSGVAIRHAILFIILSPRKAQPQQQRLWIGKRTLPHCGCITRLHSDANRPRHRHSTCIEEMANRTPWAPTWSNSIELRTSLEASEPLQGDSKEAARNPKYLQETATRNYGQCGRPGAYRVVHTQRSSKPHEVLPAKRLPRVAMIWKLPTSNRGLIRTIVVKINGNEFQQVSALRVEVSGR